MKLESTLPDRVGFLHVVPILDLFALLLVALLLGPAFLNQAGVQVELPVSRFQLARSADATVVTVTEGQPPVLWLGRERMDEVALAERLESIRAQSATIPVAYIRSDAGVTAGEERKVVELVLGAGFRVYLLGKPAGGN